LSVRGTNQLRHSGYLTTAFIHRRDFTAALNYAGILLRTRPQLWTYVFAYLSLIAEDPEGRGLLIDELAQGPTWRVQFFAHLPQKSKNLDTPLALMTALEDSERPVTQRK